MYDKFRNRVRVTRFWLVSHPPGMLEEFQSQAAKNGLKNRCQYIQHEHHLMRHRTWPLGAPPQPSISGHDHSPQHRQLFQEHTILRLARRKRSWSPGELFRWMRSMMGCDRLAPVQKVDSKKNEASGGKKSKPQLIALNAKPIQVAVRNIYPGKEDRIK